MMAKGLVSEDESKQGKEKAMKGTLPSLELGPPILWSWGLRAGSEHSARVSMAVVTTY